MHVSVRKSDATETVLFQRTTRTMVVFADKRLRPMQPHFPERQIQAKPNSLCRYTFAVDMLRDPVTERCGTDEPMLHLHTQRANYLAVELHDTEPLVANSALGNQS